jgi:hypothetical protein
MMGCNSIVARWHLWIVLLAVLAEALWVLRQGPEHPINPPCGVLIMALLLGGGALLQLLRARGNGGAAPGGLPAALLVRPCIALLFACPGLVTRRLVPESWYCLVALQLLAPLPHRLNLPVQVFQVRCGALRLALLARPAWPPGRQLGHHRCLAPGALASTPARPPGAHRLAPLPPNRRP